MKNRSRDWVKVSRLFWHFLEHFFHAVICYKLKFCKGSPRELNSVTGEWPIRVKAASNLFNLTNKNSLNVSGRDFGGMFEGSTVPLNVPII